MNDDELRDLRDRMEIQDLIYKYCHLDDTRQGDRMANEVFTEDAIEDVVFQTFEGREQIRTLYSMPVSDTLYEAMAHLATTPWIELDGDTAVAHSYLFAFHWSKGDPGRSPVRPADFVALGVVEDQVLRTEQGWRIAERHRRPCGPSLVALGDVPEVLRAAITEAP